MIMDINRYYPENILDLRYPKIERSKLDHTVLRAYKCMNLFMHNFRTLLNKLKVTGGSVKEVKIVYVK